MPLDAKNYLDGKPHFVYTFVGLDGQNTNIDTELLREWCAANASALRVEMTPIDPRLAATFLPERVIDPIHLMEVALMPSLDPIIYVHDGGFTNGFPDVLLADGHHRYYLAYKLGMRNIPSYILTEQQWRPFEIIGMPTQTREELIQAPTKAEYQRRRESR